jgi:hypothetical protein
VRRWRNEKEELRVDVVFADEDVLGEYHSHKKQRKTDFL